MLLRPTREICWKTDERGSSWVDRARGCGYIRSACVLVWGINLKRNNVKGIQAELRRWSWLHWFILERSPWRSDKRLNPSRSVNARLHHCSIFPTVGFFPPKGTFHFSELPHAVVRAARSAPWFYSELGNAKAACGGQQSRAAAPFTLKNAFLKVDFKFNGEKVGKRIRCVFMLNIAEDNFIFKEQNFIWRSERNFWFE